MKPKQGQEVAQVSSTEVKMGEAPAVSAAVTEVTRLDLLEGFADLVSERMGYWAGRRSKQTEMAEKCKTELEALRKKRGEIADGIEELLEKEDQATRDAIHTARKELKPLMKKAKNATQPFREKIGELAKAVKLLDNVTIPDSLKELGKQVVPRFSLSEHVAKALAAQAKRKKRE